MSRPGGPAGNLTTPAQIELVNRDGTAHPVVVEQLLPGPPVGTPSDAGSRTRVAFDVDIPASASRTIEIPEPGRYRIRLEGQAQPAEEVRVSAPDPTTYEIAWRRDATSHRFAGQVEEESARHHPVQVPSRPVDHVEVQLEWDDSEDDLKGPDGSRWVRSKPDEFRLTVTGPTGERTPTETASARQGRIVVRFPTGTDRPAEVQAHDPWSAYRQAGGEGPLHDGFVGTLNVSVSLEEAGDTPASPGQGPTEDHSSSYNLTVSVVETHPYPVGPGSPPPSQTEGRQRADHQGHDHGGHSHG